MQIKKSVLSVLLFGAILISLPAIELPDSLGVMKKTSSHNYEPKGLGRSVRYEFNAFRMDVYIYNMDDKNIGDGIEGENVKEAFAVSHANVEEIKEHEGYTDFQVIVKDTYKLRCTGGRMLNFLHAAYTYKAKGGIQLYSELFVTGYDGNFFKIRFTSPAAHAKAHNNLLAQSMNSLAFQYFYKGSGTNVDSTIASTFLRATEALENDPDGDGKIVISAIRKYVDDSPDVFVIFQDSTIGWIKDVPNEYKDIFLTAFAAGNVREQLNRKICEDQPLPGVRCVIKTYLSWRETHPDKEIKSIETLIEMDKNGELERHLKKPKDATDK